LLRSQGKFVCGCADSGVSRHLTRDRSGAGVKPLAPWTWWRCDLPGRWLGMLEIVCPNPQLEIRLGRDRRAVASEAASLATLRLTGETLKPFAAIQRASAGSRSAVHCRTESIRWIAPRFSLLSAQMAGVPCLVVGPLHAARKTSVCLDGACEQESPVPEIRARPQARVAISAVAPE
jgi:hypothetical protein